MLDSKSQEMDNFVRSIPDLPSPAVWALNESLSG